MCSLPPAGQPATFLKTNCFSNPGPKLSEPVPWRKTKARSNAYQQKLWYYKNPEKARSLAHRNSCWPHIQPSLVLNPSMVGCGLLLLPTPLVARLASDPEAGGKTHLLIHPPPTPSMGNRGVRRDGGVRGPWPLAPLTVTAAPWSRLARLAGRSKVH